MPLVPNIDLTNFGEVSIIAEDIDFSNTKMHFNIVPLEYFALDYKALGNRQYQAILKVSQYVRYDNNLTLTIVAIVRAITYIYITLNFENSLCKFRMKLTRLTLPQLQL